MIYFPELGTVVVSASYVVDEHAFPVVDQDKFSSGAQVPARPVSLVPVAAAGPTPAAADSGDGGGGNIAAAAAAAVVVAASVVVATSAQRHCTPAIDIA